MSTTSPHHIIAIGASSVAIEDINAFFEHPPVPGAAYVIVQHLPEAIESSVPQLLSNRSSLPVKEATDQMPLAPNEIYLIPKDKYLTIEEDKFKLIDKVTYPASHQTINTFFKALAQNIGKKVIAIILSGKGKDGANGVRHVKKAGGLVIARNPETASHSSMPAHTIASGMVDFILEPRLMHTAIVDYLKFNGNLPHQRADDDKLIKTIIDLVKEKSPLDFTDYKQSTILRRTKKRAAYNNFTTLDKYLEFLRSNPDEVNALVKEYMISVTAFFRDPEAFDLIKTEVVGRLLRKLEPGEELKVWVAGCATGEEVYSLAILICESLTGRFKDTIVKIFATDIDNEALTHAGVGIYDSGITEHVSAERLNTFFTRHGESYKIKPFIRKLAIFAEHDLVKNPPYCNMHLIVCRNLLIYMTPILQKKVFNMLLFGLKQDSFLFLGSSESPVPIMKSLEVVSSKWKIYKNLEPKRLLRFDAFSLPDLLEIKRTPALVAKDDTYRKIKDSLSDEICETLFADLGYLTVCINENNQVIKSYGDATEFLLPVHYTNLLTDLLPKSLSLAFSSLKKTVLETGNMAKLSGINFKRGKATDHVDLSMRQLKSTKENGRLFVITFIKSSSIPAETNAFDAVVHLDKYVINLEQEVQQLNEKLLSSFEQIDSTNENMQTFNEELLSAYEEMQSANEEIQSVNEELDTINQNFHQKNKELMELNDDLNNYFKSNVNGQLIINNDLQLMKFSPAAVKLVNLLETDIGRPISNISTNIKFESIIDDIRKVIDNGIVLTKEVQTIDGRWYQAMTMPYIRQEDEKTNGVIITFNDVSELKKIQGEQEDLLRVNSDLDHFAHIASHDLLAPLGNLEGSIASMNKMKLTNPEFKELLDVINSSVKGFRSLIKNISSIAQVDDAMELMETIDIHTILDDVEHSLDLQIKLSGTRIIRNLEAPSLIFSKRNFGSLMFNLITNAIKYKSSKPPIIVIYSRMESNKIIITVQDNGIGIAEEHMDNIFNLHGKLNNSNEGKGIGLYLAKKIIQSSGGKFAIESEPGKGSKFTLSFLQRPRHPGVAPNLN
jgi:two-component system CheB/CheR fusion protein